MGRNDFADAVGREFSRVELGDPRRNARAVKVAAALGVAPSKGLPQVMGDDGQLEGAYRFLSNRHFTYSALVHAHAEETGARCRKAGAVLVLHDTTEMKFAGVATREGLGLLRGKDQGFLAHVAIAVTQDELHQPLGALGLECWARHEKRDRGPGEHKNHDPVANEGLRWKRVVDEARSHLDPQTSVIHVMDREADDYALFSHLIDTEQHFVIRARVDRLVAMPDDGFQRMSVALSDISPRLKKAASVSKRAIRSIPGRGAFPIERAARTCQIEYAAKALELRRPEYLVDEPPGLLVNVVTAQEVNPPAGVEPVSWVLLTSEPISTPADIAAIVRHYHGRWLIEEFFKALKSGCAFEERQLESFDALTKALALFLPVAWQMLLMRFLAREAPHQSAAEVLSVRQIAVLIAMRKQTKMPADATVVDALYAVAALGGHIKNNGAPGWQVLARGFETLLVLEMGWQLRAEI